MPSRRARNTPSRVKGQPALLTAAINEAIDKLEADGTIEELTDKCLG